MLKELFELVKGSANDSVINNTDVPNEHNDEVMAEATNTVASGLRNVVAGGGVKNLLGLFEGNGSDKKSLLSNPIVSMMMGHFAGKLMNKFNLNSSQANDLSGNLIPSVLEDLINKTNDSNNATFSLENILGSITGFKKDNNSNSLNAGGGLGELLGKIIGNNQLQGSGGNDILDIIKSMTNGAQQQQQRNGGGLLDLIKAF